MKIIQIIIYGLIISILNGGDETVEGILLKTYHRLDSVNHQFTVHFKQTGKKKKNNNYRVFVNWPGDGEILRETRVEPILHDKKKPSSFWEHRFRDGRKSKKWITLPVTGKLKDVSKKKSKKKFSLEDLEFTEKDIKNNDHIILSHEKLNNYSVYVIESVEKGKSGNVKESKKLWIDKENYFIHKAEFYTKSGRLYRSAECKDIQFIKGIAFPSQIFVEDLKSKSQMQLQLTDIRLNPEFDLTIFIPRDQ